MMESQSTDSKFFFNRELSWVRFNERVLEEAMDESQPLMERLKFLAIFSSNLDEFFMVRVAGLKEQVEAQITEATPDGLTPSEQLARIAEMLHALTRKQDQVFSKQVKPALEAQQVHFLGYDALTAEQQAELEVYFREKIFPVLTPLAIDPSHPFPKLRGLGLNLLVELEGDANGIEGDAEDAETKVAVIPLPTQLPRFYAFVDKPAYRFLLVEEIIERHIHLLFPNMKILELSRFRITRNADLDISEAEADDLLKLIERELRKRRLGTVLRLEVSAQMSESNVEYLQESFGLTPEDLYRVHSPLDLATFMQLMDQVDERGLKDEPFTPAPHPTVSRSKSIFEAIRSGDILLHHPYDSFYPVIELIQEAARDPQVLAIKQTLYRTTGKSAVALALKEAATNGKQVTALIEIKARFDEEVNITWAKELERAGANVAYGIMGLKTHGKMALIVRQEPDGIRNYVHLSTGNYNERTATIYTDLGLLTCRRDIGADVSELFNLLTGYSRQDAWRKIFVAPITMRHKLMEHIDACISHAVGGEKAVIRIMMNSLVDMEMIEALYNASRAGVQIDLIIRGICCLVPGVPGLSENIRVRSIVGRFLEHMRVYSFTHSGQEYIYSGSADWMPRNLTRRIEVAFPIEEPVLKKQVHQILDVLLSDNCKARLLQSDGSYAHFPKARRNGKGPVSAQAVFLAQARERVKAIDTIYSAH